MKTLRLLNLGCFLLFCIAVSSQSKVQRKLNLDFNEYDESRELSKGWFKWGNTPLPIETELNGNANYVGKVINTKKGKFGAIVYVMRAGFEGDTIEITASMKIENVEKKGGAGFIVRMDNGDNMLALVNEPKINGTRDWAQYSIKLPYPNKTDIIYVGGIIDERGTAWFDNFKITIDGVDIQKLKVLKKPSLKENTETVIQLLKKSSKPLNLSNEETLTISLQPLIEAIGDKKIIAIGEDTHGTSEYYKLREAITKKLILEKGFNTVILESPYDDIELLTKNLEKDPLNKLMQKHLFSIYQTEEMKSFLDWYALNNKNGSIKFKGSDDSFWVLEELLEKELPSIKDEVLNTLIRAFKKAIQRSRKSSIKNEIKNNVAVYESIVAIEQYLNEKDLHTLDSKEVLFNGKNTYINYKHLLEGKAIQSRDEVMADRIAYLAKDPNTKIIIWAHNAHISNTVIIDNEIGIMGRDLKKEFGNNYLSIGLSSLSGDYSYMKNRFINSDHKYDDTLFKGTTQLQPNISWEKTFSQSSDSPFYANFIKMRKNADNNISGNLRLFGYGKETSEDYNKLSVLTMFDFLIFLNNTKNTTPLIKK